MFAPGRMLLLGLLVSLVALAANADSVVDDFNPMELYVGQNEGVSLAFEDDGQKVTYCHYGESVTGYYHCSGADYNNVAQNKYTRVLVGASKGDDVYPLTFHLYNEYFEDTEEKMADIKVQKNNDGTVALRCESNGKYITWGNHHTDEGRWEANWFEPIFPACLEDGICPTCRFSLKVGAITDIEISIVDLTWGDPEEPIPSSPSQVAEDFTTNYSDEPINTRLKVVYTNTISDTTSWSHAWGFNLGVSAEFKIGTTGISTTASVSYDGTHGTSNTETDSEAMENWKDVICPGHTRCILKYVANKLDNYNMPFIATVERTQDDGPPIQWKEEGVWTGVQAFNFDTIYCSENLDTGVSNCPT